MNDIDVRCAEMHDVDSILEIFMEQFPFLQECKDRARKDVIHRVTRDDSVTVVAVCQDKIFGIARGYEDQGVYLMNSICTVSSLSFINRSRVLLVMLPFFVKTCMAHAEKLNLSKAFYGTEVKSLSRLVPILCNLNGFSITPGNHNKEDGFWIAREGCIE